MKELLVLSGKGGAGKTSIAGCFAKLAAPEAVFIDCDVDASNLPLILGGKVEESWEFTAGLMPEVDAAKCSGCGICRSNCRFDAITMDNGKPVFSGECESCTVCGHFCPVQAISFRDRVCGFRMRSESESGTLFHAELSPGAENSGKLIAELRKNARSEAEKRACRWIISDGPPGIGCPVISSATGVDEAVIVTEPSVSGIHDMQRLATLLRQFEIPFSVIINKADLSEVKCDELRSWCQRNNISILGEIPFDRIFSRALVEMKTVLDYPESAVAGIIRNIWEKINSKAEK